MRGGNGAVMFHRPERGSLMMGGPFSLAVGATAAWPERLSEST
jgi:hypothetical protein